MKKFETPEVVVLRLATESVLDVQVGGESGAQVTIPEIEVK